MKKDSKNKKGKEPVKRKLTEAEKARLMKKKKIINIIVVIVAILGIGFIAYPIISNRYYTIKTNYTIKDFDDTVKKISKEEINRRMKLAHAYNAAIYSGTESVPKFRDPYSEEEKREGIAEYARMLEVHEKIGHIKIPSINIDLPIFAGTSSQVLQMGVGHMESSSLPVGGKNTHSILTGHRGLPKARLFTDLNRMKIGDTFYIKNLGGTLAYEVDQIKVIEPTKFDDLRIVPGYDYVTLLTCTPYMINSHRLLVRGHRVPYNPAKEKEEKKKGLMLLMMKIGIGVLIIAILLIIRGLKKKKKKRKSESKKLD